MSKIKTYSELRKLDTFEERYAYLKLSGEVGLATFGYDRLINQNFYHSYEWKQTRRTVIMRDEGCDLGIPGYEIYNSLLIHHMNPITLEDIVHANKSIFDPEYLITTTKKTHNAIHFGDERRMPSVVTARVQGDTHLW